MTPRLSAAVKSLRRRMRRGRAEAPVLVAPPLIPEGVSAAAPRLIAVTTERHRATFRALAEVLAGQGVRLERWGYPYLFAQESLPRAGYVLTDFDRLHPWQLELAGRVYRRLVEAGVAVLNDPCRFVPRVALLQRLRAEGINGFGVWLPVAGEMPDRFPVFLRTIHAHRGAASGLLGDAAAAGRALEAALAKGRVLSDLAFVEYAAEPVAGTAEGTGERPGTGLFRKHACYRVGDRLIRALTVTEAGWVAKDGTLGAASDADYAADLAEQTAYPHDALMRRVFDIAGARYGRVDFGMVAGRPQIYELNTNPNIRFSDDHPNADRRTATVLIREALTEALAALAPATPGPPIPTAELIRREPPHLLAFGQA